MITKHGKMDKRAIGIFDSGVGGLTVADKVLRLLPGENVIYFGDTARVPYGNKSKETVTRFSKEIVRYLLRYKVKLVIVACNTASSLSLEALRHSFSVPIVSVITPGVEEALRVSTSGRIGVIGTDATVASNAYKKQIKRIDKQASVFQRSCPLFVPLVENRWLKDDITVRVAQRYLLPLLRKKIDTLILGCTHYPLLKDVIQRIAGRGVTLVDSSTAVADYTKKLLASEGLTGAARRHSVKFFVSDDTRHFVRLAKVFLRENINAQKVIW
jgi:glutamate racemase